MMNLRRSRSWHGLSWPCGNMLFLSYDGTIKWQQSLKKSVDEHPNSSTSFLVGRAQSGVQGRPAASHSQLVVVLTSKPWWSFHFETNQISTKSRDQLQQTRKALASHHIAPAKLWLRWAGALPRWSFINSNRPTTLSYYVEYDHLGDSINYPFVW